MAKILHLKISSAIQFTKPKLAVAYTEGSRAKQLAIKLFYETVGVIL